jgi:glycosyltransferase involved in cell wall biosynthesis
MIANNESANIAGVLECFSPFADELIVVDTGSNDNTKEIASRFTSGIYDFEWNDDFSAAGNFAMSKAGKSYHLAYSFYCMNDRKEALKLINDAAGQGSEIGKSWEWIGTKAFLLNNMELAAIGLETALRFGTLEPANWRRLAAVYKLRGLFHKSEECLMRATGRI